MPLHLLGKKSWNVYNTAAIERVRRDEADAKAREEAAEQRMQEQDAEHRIAILRGENPLPLPEIDDGNAREDASKQRRRDNDGVPRERKRRRLRGEDETEAEIRIAREDVEAGRKVKEVLGPKSREGKAGNVELVDGSGHIQLVPVPDERETRKAEKNTEFEAEKAKKRKREEDQVTMRFSNAAGYSQGMAKPWYAAESPRSRTNESSKDLVLAETQGKDVWGNEDPRRKSRDQGRITSNDPFAMMQVAQRQLKLSEGDRAKWQAERDRETEELKRAEEKRRRHEKRHRRRHDRGGEDDLENFSLDAPPKDQGKECRHRDREGKHRSQRHRHRSHERSGGDRSRERSGRDRSRERRH